MPENYMSLNIPKKKRESELISPVCDPSSSPLASPLLHWDCHVCRMKDDSDIPDCVRAV